jgi:DNA polymerase-3 subunit delta
MDSLTFLDKAPRAKPQPIYVLTGDEPFLRRRVLAALRALALGADGDDAGLSTYSGDKATYAAVFDELQTVPFLSTGRLVLVEDADPFVTRERARLEKYFAGPTARGVLALTVKSFPATTKLAKLLPDAGLITCKAPPAARLAEWCVAWSAAQHGKPLTRDAARLLVELVGAEMGQLDMEMAKLAVYAGARGRVDAEDVDALVGNRREQKVWGIFDQIGAGQAAEALTLLDRLLTQGEEPLALLGAFSSQLRKLAQTAALHGQGVTLGEALEQAGVPPFARRGVEQQLRHLGRRRLGQLYDWLLQTDLGLKGGSQLPPRTLLERLVVRLARPAAARPGGAP